jgi:hypothetical protein
MLNGLEIGNAALGTYVKFGIARSPRPNNIGIGIWNRQISNQLDDAAGIFGSSADDVTAGIANGTKTGFMPKGIKALGYVGVGIDVGTGIYDNVKEGSSVEKTASDAVVDGAFSVGGMLAASAAGAKLGALGGSFVPGFGNIIGAVGGAVVSGAIYALTDGLKVNGKSVKDHIKDGISNLFDWD